MSHPYTLGVELSNLLMCVVYFNQCRLHTLVKIHTTSYLKPQLSNPSNLLNSIINSSLVNLTKINLLVQNIYRIELTPG